MSALMWFVLLGHQQGTVLIGVARGSDRAVPQTRKESASEECEALTSSVAVPKAVIFYDNHGFWSGLYTMRETHQTRISSSSDASATLHLRYTFFPVPNNPMDLTDVGQDQRTFNFVCVDGAWSVVTMGEFMSASGVGE
jgi:hypothetical protein